MIALAAALLALASVPTAVGAAQKGTVEGTLLDTTCAVGCQPECPPPPVCRDGRVVACPRGHAAGRIVCPLTRRVGPAARFCTQAGCPGPPVVTFPPFEGSDGKVILRRTGSSTVLRKLPVSGGHFSARLAPGSYVLLAHVARPCWTGTKEIVQVTAGRTVASVLSVTDECVANPDARR